MSKKNLPNQKALNFVILSNVSPSLSDEQSPIVKPPTISLKLLSQNLRKYDLQTAINLSTKKQIL